MIDKGSGSRLEVMTLETMLHQKGLILEQKVVSFKQPLVTVDTIQKSGGFIMQFLILK